MMLRGCIVFCSCFFVLFCVFSCSRLDVGVVSCSIAVASCWLCWFVVPGPPAPTKQDLTAAEAKRLAYKKSLEDQIRQKKERKAREKAEEQQRERKLMHDIQHHHQRRGGAGEPYRDANGNIIARFGDIHNGPGSVANTPRGSVVGPTMMGPGGPPFAQLQQQQQGGPAAGGVVYGQAPGGAGGLPWQQQQLQQQQLQQQQGGQPWVQVPPNQGGAGAGAGAGWGGSPSQQPQNGQPGQPPGVFGGAAPPRSPSKFARGSDITNPQVCVMCLLWLGGWWLVVLWLLWLVVVGQRNNTRGWPLLARVHWCWC